jgi:hypothetical protein
VNWLGPADLALQQAAWWAAVLLAAHGRPLAAAAPSFAAVLLHVALRPVDRPRLLRAALVAAGFGLLSDTALAAAGLATFAGAGRVSPAWMVSLWAAFGVGLTASMGWAVSRPAPFLAALGAVAGPLAYRSGVGLGALALGGVPALAAVAAQWAVALPLLVRVARPRQPSLALAPARVEAGP